MTHPSHEIEDGSKTDPAMWSSSVSGIHRIEARIADLTKRSQAPKIGAREWISIVGLMLALVGMGGAVATTVFAGRAETGAVAAKFEAHCEAQRETERKTSEALREISIDIKEVSRKIDRQRR